MTRPLSPRVIAISVVRDERDVIAASIRGLIDHHVDEILVVDNGSGDGTSRILHRLSKHFPLRVLRDDGPYDQAAIMTALAAEAHARGADWVVPFDADEFFYARGDLVATLAFTPHPWLLLPVVNLVQSRARSRSSPRGLTSMDRIARPWAAREDVLAGRASFVELRYPPKVVFRAAPDVVVEKGQHRVRHPDGTGGSTSELCILHAPLRSLQAMRQKVDRAERHLSMVTRANQSWQYRRWGQLDPHEVIAEWRANSHREGVLHRHDGTTEFLSRVPLSHVVPRSRRRVVQTFRAITTQTVRARISRSSTGDQFTRYWRS